VLRALRAAARRIDASSIELAALGGGTARRSYLASSGGEAWVVRTPANHFSGALDLRVESDVTQIAGEHGVTPRVVSCDAEAGLLITEYHAGAAALTPEAARHPDNIARIARLLRRLHQLRPPLRAFDPEDFAARYVGDLGGASALSVDERRFADLLRALARDYRSRYPDIVLCHNDLVASNILDDGGRLWLIDFEYAATAAPVLDLAGLAAMNDFGRYERLVLTDAYYDSSPVPFSPDELDKVVRLVRLLAYFWALSRAREDGDPAPYERMAAELAAALK
jgi:thiamine kinase-like enzyme